MKKTIAAVVLLFASVSALWGAEPVKRETASEISSILLNLPYGADIDFFIREMGPPMEVRNGFIVYKLDRTGSDVLIYQTPFNTIESAEIVEACESKLHAEARYMLISEQFSRRFGAPVEQGEDFSFWHVKDVGVLSAFLEPEFDKLVIYRVAPYFGR